MRSFSVAHRQPFGVSSRKGNVMYDFPEEIPGQIAPGQIAPGQIAPKQLQDFTRNNLGIELTDVEANKFTEIIGLLQTPGQMGAEGGGPIGDTGFTGPIDVPTRGPPPSAIGVRAGGADRDRMMQQLIRRPGYQGLGY
jgi:hypothetical protein